MVEKVILLPDDVVENVAQRHGEVSIEAVKQAYTDNEITEFQRRAAGDDTTEVTALAALDPTERERVEEAAAEAEMHPAVWLAETAAEVVEEGGPIAGPESLAEQVERTIFRRTPV